MLGDADQCLPSSPQAVGVPTVIHSLSSRGYRPPGRVRKLAGWCTWVMQRAGVPAFRMSAGHFDYVRAARRDPEGSPYRFLDPLTTAPATGDMLCYVRTQRVYGHAGLHIRDVL